MFITQVFWVLLALIFFFIFFSLKKTLKKSKMIKYKDNPFHVVAYYAN